jgi:DNA ligase-associated metallophosphoesterase
VTDSRQYEIRLGGELFYLLFHKALFRPAKKQLILSDIHLGKASHFRKKGIALPPQSHLKDIDKLEYLIKKWSPRSVLILGDLFHSQYNREWLWFKALLMGFPRVKFILVEGNHDILSSSEYNLPNLSKKVQVNEERFIFSHAALENPSKINICGHVHPGIRITGVARQSITLPCFYFNGRHFILPAFGDLTGLAILEKEIFSDYYLVTHQTVVKL